jgi:hypothetical protein
MSLPTYKIAKGKPDLKSLKITFPKAIHGLVAHISLKNFGKVLSAEKFSRKLSFSSAFLVGSPLCLFLLLLSA